MKTTRVLLSLLAVSILATPAFAGGPIAQCAPGQAFVWGGGGANIPYNPDMGDLVVPGDNAASVQLVADAFQVWEDVPTASATYVNAGPLPVDVTGDLDGTPGPPFDGGNVLTYWAEPAPDGLSPIIFDFDGSAGAVLGFPSGVLGVAGIAWVNTVTCEATEGVALLIGPTFAGDPTAAFDVTVHEFGHYSGLGHTVVNGQIYLGSVGGDNSGPTPNDTFLPIPNPFTEVVETMYPFYYGAGIGSGTLHKDDETTLSELYPEPSFASTTAAISGATLIGLTPVTGANVIARNVADPFNDAVSAISGDFSVGADAFTGQWDIEGLTPGADYAVYVDEILAGGFSTPVLSPLPGPEDFYNGASESSDPNVDDPSVFTTVSAAAGGTTTGVDIIFNQPGEGDPLPVGDDGSVQLALPFQFCVQGEPYGSVFVNANGNVTFGAGDTDFSESAQEFLDGPPRVAGMWHDLDPTSGGSVFYNTTGNSFKVTWEDVPEWGTTTANTFDITLYDNSRSCVEDDGSDSDSDSDSGSDSDSDSDSDSGWGGHWRRGSEVKITHTSMDLADGLVGVSGGIPTTSGAEMESNLSRRTRNFRRPIWMWREAAVFEDFVLDDADYDMNGKSVKFKWVGKAFRDRFERNDSLRRARRIPTPFDTVDTRRRYSSIDPAAADIDFYRFHAEANQTLLADVTRGQIDSVLGLFLCEEDEADSDSDSDSGSDSDSDSDSDWWRKVGKCRENTAILIDANDDAGTGSNPLLSSLQTTLPVTGTYALGVTFCCDYDFDGEDPGQGAPFDKGRYVLDVQLVDGVPLPLGDDTTVDLSGFGFDVSFDGNTYSNVFVNSNGNVTFGAGDPFGFISDIPAFESGPPRAAPLWQDLDATNSLVLADTDFAGELTITWVDVPEFGGAGANNFSVTLTSTGDVEYNYGSVTATAGVIGTAQGNGAPSTAVDLSATGGGSVSASTVEQFDFLSPYDLSNPANLVFTP